MDNKTLTIIGTPRFVEANFKINRKFVFDGTNVLNININITNEFNENKNDDTLHLCSSKVTLKNDGETEIISIKVVIEGIFKIEKNTPENIEIFKKKAPDMLLTFVRSYVLDMTSKAGINPISIPYFELND